MQSREELFALAAQDRKANLEKQKSGFNSDYEQVSYVALENTYRQLRILGNPLDRRMGDPFSPKLINIAMIVGDDGKKFRCVFPSKQEEPSWIMWRLLSKVLSYNYDKANKKRSYHHEGKHTFQTVFTNNSSSPFDKGWQPTQFILMNVIDRLSMDWHTTNKHTLILSKKGSEYNGAMWYEPGVAQKCYSLIWDEIVPKAGDWEDYDILVKKLPDDPRYKVLHATKDPFNLQPDLGTFAYFPQMAEQPLSAEERSWERYNFDKIFPKTTHTKILNKVRAHIAEIDAVHKTAFLPELEKQSELEKAEWDRQAEAAAQAEQAQATAGGSAYVAPVRQEQAPVYQSPVAPATYQAPAAPAVPQYQPQQPQAQVQQYQPQATVAQYQPPVQPQPQQYQPTMQPVYQPAPAQPVPAPATPAYQPQQQPIQGFVPNAPTANPPKFDGMPAQPPVYAAPAQPVAPAPAPQQMLYPPNPDPSVYRGWPQLTPSEQALLMGIRQDGSLQWAVPTQALCTCSVCGCVMPDTVAVCAGCGARF